MSIKEMEAELEATRQKIAEQLSMVGRSIQSIDPTLYDKERVLEQAVIDAHLDAPTQDLGDPPIWGKNAIGLSRSLPHPVYYDAPTQDLGDIAMPSVAAAVLELLTPPHGRFFRNGVEHTLTQEDYNEETCAFVEEQDQPMSSNKWVHNARKQVELPYKPVMELADLIAPHEGDKE